MTTTSQSDSLTVEISLILSSKSTILSDSSSSRDSPRDQSLTISKPLSTKLSCGFVLLEQEVYKGTNKGIIPSNIIKGKYNCKIAFIIELLFWDLIEEPISKYYISFLIGIIYKELKLRIRDLPILSKKYRELDSYLYEARFKQEQKVEYKTL